MVPQRVDARSGAPGSRHAPPAHAVPGSMRCTPSATASDDGWIRSPASLFGYVLEAGYTLTPVRGVPPAGDDLGMRPRFMGPLRQNACPLARERRRKPPMS